MKDNGISDTLSSIFEGKHILGCSLHLVHFCGNCTLSFGFTDNEVDGEAFLELSIGELNPLIPQKLGIVKKIYHLIQSVSVPLIYVCVARI